MALAIQMNGQWERWDGWLGEARHNTLDVERCWSPAELEDAGLAVIQPAIIPPGKVPVGGPVLVDDDGVPRESYQLDDVPQPKPPSLAEYAAMRRWEAEVGGTTWSGWSVHTDRESQGKIVAEVLAIERGERQDGDAWKFADGEFRALTNADMEALALAVRTHIRDAFAIEAQVLADIAAGNITTMAEIDAAFAGGVA